MGILKQIIVYGTTIAFFVTTAHGLNERGIQQQQHHKHGEETPPRYEERVHEDVRYVLSGSMVSSSETVQSSTKKQRWSLVDADAATYVFEKQ